MTELELLEDLAYNDDIDVLDASFESKRKGISMVSGDLAAVLLNNSRIKNSAEKTCVLAEEIGHVKTGTFIDCEDYLDPSFVRYLKVKGKMRATEWAIKQILPLEKLMTYIDRCFYESVGLDIWEMCDYLNLTPEFISSAIDYYIRKGELDECWWESDD